MTGLDSFVSSGDIERDKKLSVRTSTIITDAITDEISNTFDYEFDGTTDFIPHDVHGIPENFSIGLIVGASGSGKSTMLELFGEDHELEWDHNKAVCSHFDNATDAKDRLSSVGFNNIKDWMKPFHVLSNGQKFRVELARKIKSNAVIDEFTSVVDRQVAQSCSHALQRYIRQKEFKNIVFCSCHYDIIEWLQPDWVYDTEARKLTFRESLRRPEIKIELHPCSTKEWAKFRDHHYLSSVLLSSARCWIATWNDTIVGFTSAISMPSGTVKNAWRGHRTVVLPEFQGLGIGVRLTDAMAEMMTLSGKVFYSRASHYRMGMYRNRSPYWEATVANGRPSGKDDKNSSDFHERHDGRICYSHKYVNAGQRPDMKINQFENECSTLDDFFV